MTILAFLQYILAENGSPSHRSFGSTYRSGINPSASPENGERA